MICILQSCTSQPDFDLTELTLKSEKISSLVPDIKNKAVYPYRGNGIRTEYVIIKNITSTHLLLRSNGKFKKEVFIR